ncbi:Nucleotide-binding universal stress protein, UspA family [Halobiforma haloterrestris]|uniref:Nucleotide-binding universal stress protein, UspA family n=1 Tax=Natronobacterium haloterrestre TaxID=148448 RepID=A0A1I1ERJ7_NATHA|nr:universal stress protein [Halobiforma haloterrestris]SFB87513.1 Nucleotide-binding universal stress protein, UspA family [Halobiforma haloterrestris]
MVILAAVDESERAKDVAETAYDLAAAYDDTLVPFHAIPNEEYTAHKESLEGIPGMQGLSISQEEDSAKEFARKIVLESVDDVDLDRIQPEGRVGDVTESILSRAESLEPRYLVIGGRRLSPTGKALFGNTTQQVLLNADCPVVTLMDDE